MDPQSEAQQLVGAVFNGRWKLTRLLGEGGMGAVYEAQSREGTRAIRVLHPEFVSEEQIYSRFVAEAQAVKSLQHPNVAQIFESARAEDGTPYLVMELLQGAPLSNHMTPGRGMAVKQACSWMMGCLSALSQAHQRGIVHRDLKPDNLFIVGDGRGGQMLKVLDFGIAKVMDAAGGMGSKTKTGVLLGTPGYMSPEQIKNSKGVDPRSDLWSVGIILYELLTGHEAFPADNEFTRLTLVLTQDIRPITDVAPQLAAFGPFFQRALSKDLATRFQSAAEMSAALGAFIGAPASQAAPATQGQGQAPPHGTAVLSMNSPQMHMPMSGSPSTMGGAMAPVPSAPAGAPRQNYSNAPPPQSFQPQVHSVSVPSAGYGNTPPNSGPQGPSTHISPNRGGSTLHTGSGGPAVELMKPPPVGVPWWVVGAVAVATLVVGFIAGYFAH